MIIYLIQLRYCVSIVAILLCIVCNVSMILIAICVIRPLGILPMTVLANAYLRTVMLMDTTMIYRGKAATGLLLFYIITILIILTLMQIVLKYRTVEYI